MSDVTISTTIKIPDDGKLDIRNAAVYAGMTEGNLRSLVRRRVIPATKEAVEGSQVHAWRIAVADLDAYKTRPRTGGTRTTADKTKFYRIKVSPEHKDAVVAALSAMGIELQDAYKAPKKSADPVVASGAFVTPPEEHVYEGDEDEDEDEGEDV